MTRHILILFFFALNLIPVNAQMRIPEPKPRLVVFLMLDELSTQQLDIIRSKCSERGFNRLFSGGANFRNAGYLSGATFAGRNVASLFSGTTPSTHGITGRSWINRFNGIETDAVYGPYTHQRLDTVGKLLTNLQMLSSTLGDELQRMHNGQSKIFTIGFHPENMVWSLSRNQDPMFWFDMKTGNMLSNQKNQPAWVNEFNNKGMATLYTERIWAPLTDIQEYHEWKYYKSTTPRTFYYPLKNSKDPYFYQRISGSPFGNSLMRDFAASLLLNEKLGKDEVPDVLTIEFTTIPSVYPKSLPLDAESEDLLLRLDQEIESLLSLIDKEVGLHNTLVVCTAIKSPSDLNQTAKPFNQPRGVFNAVKASSLLNLYLMAVHGQGKWVLTQKSGEIYLNNELIAKSKIDRNVILKQSCDFLLQVEGISNALSAADLITSNTIWPSNRSMLLNYHLKRSGDIVFHLEPGWVEELPNGQKTPHSWDLERVPLSIYGWRISRQHILQSTEMTQIVPTICSFLEIPMPNGSDGVTLQNLLP